MGPRVLLISLVPPAVLARMLQSLRASLPEGHMTALLGAPDAAPSRASARPDELLDWRRLGGRALVAELRRRHLDLVVVAHGGDHCLTCSYWKALALALCSGARAKLLCEEGRLSSQVTRLAHHPSTWAGLLAPTSLLGRSAAGAALLAAQEAYVAATGLLLLAPVLLGIVITDLTEALSGGRSAGGARGHGKGRG